jgi:hypothetical protein
MSGDPKIVPIRTGLKWVGDPEHQRKCEEVRAFCEKRRPSSHVPFAQFPNGAA